MLKHAYHQAVTLVLALTVTGVAAAHSPPSLVKRQAAAAHALKGSAGYRDMHARFGDSRLRSARVAKAPGGYRDIAHRFGPRQTVND
jgi:hypothetical protein